VTGGLIVLTLYLLADAILTNARVPTPDCRWTHFVSLALATVFGTFAWWSR
jgi:hypothetical protein